MHESFRRSSSSMACHLCPISCATLKGLRALSAIKNEWARWWIIQGPFILGLKEPQKSSQCHQIWSEKSLHGGDREGGIWSCLPKKHFYFNRYSKLLKRDSFLFILKAMILNWDPDMFLKSWICENVKDLHKTWRGSVSLHHILTVGVPQGSVLTSPSSSVLIIY